MHSPLTPRQLITRALPAAVIEAHAPAANDAARVVPANARRFLTGKNGKGALMAYTVQPTRARRFTASQARAAVRLRELATLASWRAQFGVLSDPTGWAAVAADALAELAGVGEWRCDAAGIAAQLPPGTEDAAAAVAAALAAPHRPGRLLSGRDAGRLVDLVALEADDASMGKAITTMVARDVEDAELAARRRQRRREAARERKRRARAKCVTPKNVTNSVCSNVTFACHTSSNTVQRDIGRVTNGALGQAITAENVTAALAIKPGAARARLMRWLRAGVIERAGRGSYRVAGYGGGAAAPPLPPAPGRETA